MAAAHQTPIELVLQHRISPERLPPYIRETPTLHEAIRLYRWNIELSGAVYEALHVFEVPPQRLGRTTLQLERLPDGS
jgi:hypothetical protein